MAKVNIRDIDHGWRAFAQSVDAVAMRKPSVVVGVVGERAGTAAYHEFGTSRIPERSFIRSTYDEKRAVYTATIARVMATEMVDAAIRNQRWSATSSRGLRQLGLRMEGDVKKKIATNIPPPLAPSTLARKGGRTTALVFTGQMRAQITYEVRSL
jgi:hypothetical protein